MKGYRLLLSVTSLGMWFYHGSLRNGCSAAIVACPVLWAELGRIDAEIERDTPEKDLKNAAAVEPLPGEAVQ